QEHAIRSGGERAGGSEDQVDRSGGGEQARGSEDQVDRSGDGARARGGGDQVVKSGGGARRRGQPKPRAKGKSRAEPENPTESCVSFKISDFIDPVFVAELGKMPLSLYADTRFADNRKHVQGFASLRLACCQMLERNAASGGSGIESWYKEDNLLTLAQKKGRAWSGISAMTEDEAESLGFKCSSGYDATRSAFTYRKDVKELLRGGLENGDFIRDYDMKASFPAAFLERHPSLLWVGRWVNGSFMDTAVWRKASSTGRWGLEKAASGSGAMRPASQPFQSRCGCTGRRSGPAWGWTLRGSQSWRGGWP
ncbi:unnamed protein product, partial [Effrenium voratum]